MEIKQYPLCAQVGLSDGRFAGVDDVELIVHDQDMPLAYARALIAAWDRAQGALPELPPGYTIEESEDGDGWLAWSPGSPFPIVDHLPDLPDSRANAVVYCWEHFAATLDPKWAQLLRNAGLPV